MCFFFDAACHLIYFFFTYSLDPTGEPFLGVSCFQGTILDSTRPVLTPTTEADRKEFERQVVALIGAFRFSNAFRDAASLLPFKALASGEFLAFYTPPPERSSFCHSKKLPFTKSPCFDLVRSGRSDSLPCLVDKIKQAVLTHPQLVKAVYLPQTPRRDRGELLELLEKAVNPVPVYVLDDLKPHLRAAFPALTKTRFLSNGTKVQDPVKPGWNYFFLSAFERELALKAALYIGPDDNAWSQSVLIPRLGDQQLITLVTGALECPNTTDSRRKRRGVKSATPQH